MGDLFRESFVGEIIYTLSRGKLLPHPEDRPDFVFPEKHLLSVHTPSLDPGEEISDLSRPPSGPQAWRIEPKSKDDTVASTENDPTPLSDSRHHSLGGTRTIVRDEAVLEVPEDLEKGGRQSKEASEKLHSLDPPKQQGVNVRRVYWYGEDDPANPLNWSSAKKAFVTFCLCLLTFSIYIGSAIYSPGEEDLAHDFGVSITVAQLGLTLFVIGYGIGPIFLSPLTEIPSIGRNKPYIITLLIFVLLQVGTALVDDIGWFLVLRFLSGFFGSPPLATVGASISDMYSPKYRAYPIGAWGLAAICGPVLGPLIGGFASAALGWRWTIWPLLALSGFTFIFLSFVLPETSCRNIMTRRAARLRRITGLNFDALHCDAELIERSMTAKEVAVTALVRPWLLMFCEPIVLLLNLHIAFVYALLYTWFEAFPLVFIGVYGFNEGQLGLAFMGILVGALVTYFFYVVWLRKHFEPLFDKKQGIIDPEDRLPPGMVGAIFIPICLFGFGWTSTASIHWIVPIIMSSFFSVGAFLLFAAVLNFLGDSYQEYAASVLAGNDTFRSCLGGAFPLFARQMFVNLQKHGPSAFPVSWGCTLLGCIGLAMVPLPFIFYVYGPRIRKYSKYAASSS